MLYKVIQDATKSIRGRSVTGLASIFGNIDDGNDIVQPGAFAKTIQERGSRIKHLWQHMPWDPPTAVIKDLGEVTRDQLPDAVRTAFPEATGGLEVTREYLDTARGNEVLAGLKAGAITEMSFGFDIIKDGIQEVGDTYVRRIYEVRLWETSDVNWGMNPATVASKGQAAFEAAQGLDDWSAYVLDSMAKRGGDILALLNFKEGRVLSARNLDKLRTAITALQDVLAAAEPPDDPALTDSGKQLLARINEAREALAAWE